MKFSFITVAVQRNICCTLQTFLLFLYIWPTVFHFSLRIVLVIVPWFTTNFIKWLISKFKQSQKLLGWRIYSLPSVTVNSSNCKNSKCPATIKIKTQSTRESKHQFLLIFRYFRFFYTQVKNIIYSIYTYFARSWWITIC